MTDSTQDYPEACSRFVGWLDDQVTHQGRGDTTERLEVDPAATFWLGRLASQESVMAGGLGDRGERLDPCAIGIRLRPSHAGPYTFTVSVRARAWLKDSRGEPKHPLGPWQRSAAIEATASVQFDGTPNAVLADELANSFAAVGAAGLRCEVQVEQEQRPTGPEIVVQLVNITPEDQHLPDTHLYETVLQVDGLSTQPFLLEALPDSFRYDRTVGAYGINTGIETTDAGGLRTTDTVIVDTRRSHYWNSPISQPDLTFATLEADPLPSLTTLVDALDQWNDTHWSDRNLADRAGSQHWSPEMQQAAEQGRTAAWEEAGRLRHGLNLLAQIPTLRRAFQLMNRAIGYSGAGKYDSWRPFQIGFLLTVLTAITAHDQLAAKEKAREGAMGDVVDTVWFATGGGKTETYLGLLVMAALHDRLTGKTTGVTAWSRFPLRLLSLQQTQRFADALAGAERLRRDEKLGGDPISLGFFVGRGGTPNRVVAEENGHDPDPDSPGMPDQYQVLLTCPFCHGELSMRFQRRTWQLAHQCRNPDCPWPERDLPFYVVDQEVYRFLPTVVIGTLDKAASIGFQAAMRGLVGPPTGLCDQPGHGYTYAPRKSTPTGCLVPGCPGSTGRLPMPTDRWAPTFRLQDELHLLRDSLGAVDSHYESLLDQLQVELGGRRPKIIASSATLTGHDRQVEVLYRRSGRVFPVQGPDADASFWSLRSDQPLRRFVAVAPRGVTLEHVTDRTVAILQTQIRRLLDDPAKVCTEAGIDPVHVAELVSDYGTTVVYGSSLYDVEAARRSLESNNDLGLNATQLTGQTDFDEVRETLRRLENPEPDHADRIHAIAASSMLSHGVDVSRLNTMVMLGLPLGTAEFIQTTSRVGRTHPGLVYVLHKIARERDGQTFRHFHQFVTHGDRFVEPIPITRRSRRVLRLTLPGIVEARRLALWEPQSPGQRLTTLPMLRDFVRDNALDPSDDASTIAKWLGYTGAGDELLTDEIQAWLDNWHEQLTNPTSTAQWPSELGDGSPMTSLRDVEVSAPIHD